MAFTNEQLQAINSTGKNITVAASAGSGKTTVLVERIMKRVMVDKVPLDRFLAMTFTEAAANEMKSRLFARLTEYLKEHPEESEYCKEQLVLLSKAQISTIHSFCLTVIQENYAYIGFDLQRVNTIISEEEEETYFQYAFNDTIKQFESLPKFNELKQNFSSKVYDTTTLYKEIRKLASLLKETDYETYYQLNEQTYTIRCLQDLPNDVSKALFEYLSDYIAYLEEVTLEMQQIQEISDRMSVKLGYLNEMKTACKNKDYTTFKLQLNGFIQVPFPVCKEHPNYESLRKELYKIEDHLLSVLFEEETLIKDLNNQWPLIKLMLEMAKFYNERMDYYKKEFSFMDFDDMELFAYQILSQFEEVADIYRNRYIDILVDEYQDSSKHQDEILSYITNGKNIFRVGDVKQSIYRFRNATPDLLQGYIEQPKENDQVIFLQHNFRSNSQIIGYVNNIFQKFMNLSTFKSNFSPQDMALVGTDEQQREDICVEYHVIKSDEMDEELEEYKASLLRAEYIATQIKKTHEEDKVKWSDFVVLVRSNERKIDLKRAFNKLGIPNFIDSKEGFYKSSAVTYVTSFMQCVLSPYVDNYFVALALSPFYGLNDNELAKITLDMRSNNINSYYEYAKLGSNEVLTELLKDIHNLRYMGSLRDKLMYIYNVNHFYDQYTTHSDRTNLDSLLEKACAYEESHSDGLEGFCSFISSLKEFKSSEALSINSKEDVVRVMTVHQSKGLQFPYVYYWGKERANKSLDDKLLKDCNLGVFLDYYDTMNHLSRTSLLREVLSHRTSKADLEEEIRVIYVALTRPSQKLVLTTLMKSKELDSLFTHNISSYGLYDSENYAKWLLKKCMNNSSAAIKEIYSLDIDEVKAISNTSHFIPSKLPDYSHASLKRRPSDHGKLSMAFKSDGMKIGTMVHKMLEIVDFSKDYSVNDLIQIASNEFDSELVSRIQFEKILNFLNNSKTKQFANRTIHKEYPILYSENNQIISGIIDLLVEDQNTMHIIDYKTDTLTATELINHYEQQLSQYQSIIQKAYPSKTIKKYIYSLHLNEYIMLN